MAIALLHTCDIDLDGNKVLNALLHPVEVFPENPVENQVVTKAGIIYVYFDGQWRTMAAQVGTLQGAFNADTALQLPENSTKGDYWFVDVAGTVTGMFDPRLEIGTMIISNMDLADPLNAGEWIILRIGGGQATITEFGLVKLASVEETREGVNAQKAVTPYALAGMKATESEANNPLEAARFITPESLFKVKTDQLSEGIVRMATQAEIEDGTLEHVAVSPKTLKDKAPTFEKKNIHDTVMLHIQLLGPDNSVWKVSVDENGTLLTMLQT